MYKYIQQCHQLFTHSLYKCYHLHAYTPAIRQLDMLDVALIHQHNAHVQTPQTQERPALPQRLTFYILSGSCTFMQAISVNDTHMFLFSCTHKVGHNNTACRLSPIFFPAEKKCHC